MTRVDPVPLHNIGDIDADVIPLKWIEKNLWFAEKHSASILFWWYPHCDTVCLRIRQ